MSKSITAIAFLFFTSSAFALNCEVKGFQQGAGSGSTVSMSITADNEQAALAEFRRVNPGYNIISSVCK